MSRAEFITKIYEQEYNKFEDLSEDFQLDETKEDEWEDCMENVDLIEQMIEEIPSDYIKDDKETGSIQQVFIGKVEGEPVEYINCKNSKRYYYIELTIMDWEVEERYKDKRFLRLSTKVWKDWFNNYKYNEKKIELIKRYQHVYVRTIVIDGEVEEIEWYYW